MMTGDGISEGGGDRRNESWEGVTAIAAGARVRIRTRTAAVGEGVKIADASRPLNGGTVRGHVGSVQIGPFICCQFLSCMLVLISKSASLISLILSLFLVYFAVMTHTKRYIQQVRHVKLLGKAPSPSYF